MNRTVVAVLLAPLVFAVVMMSQSAFSKLLPAPGASKVEEQIQVQAETDHERAVRLIMAERERALRPYFEDQISDKTNNPVKTFDTRVQLLGRTSTALGERRLASVEISTAWRDGDREFASSRTFLVYFDTQWRMAEHHYIGRGPMRLDGSILKLGKTDFDLATKEGLAALRFTMLWC